MPLGRDNGLARGMGGLTLVEVVAALVILGVLLALIVKASTQSSRQLALAEQRLYAAREADRIIAQWLAARTPIVPGAMGRISGTLSLYWETVQRDDVHLSQLGARVVQLRMFAGADDKPTGPKGSGAAPVLSVDLVASVLPLPEAPPEDQQAAATRPSDTDDDREDPRLREPPASVPQQ